MGLVTGKLEKENKEKKKLKHTYSLMLISLHFGANVVASVIRAIRRKERTKDLDS